MRTTAKESYTKPPSARRYHVLVVVHLADDENEVFLDRSELFLIPQVEVASASTSVASLESYKFSKEQVAKLFGPLEV